MRRPVLAFVINTLIAVAGLAAFYGVEIRELPDVDRPVITVNTDFTGGCRRDDRPRTDGCPRRRGVARFRRQVDLVEHRLSAGSRVTVEFNDGVDLDVAASDMRDAVSRVANQLPEDVDPPRIVKADANADAGHAACRDLRHQIRRGHDDHRRGRDRRHAGGSAGRRRRAGLWRPRQDLPRRYQPGQGRQPRPHHRRHRATHWPRSPSTRRPAR